MDSLQKMVDRWIAELPRRFLADLLGEKLAEQGVKLSKKEREDLADGILKQKANPIGIDDGRKRRRTLTVEFTAGDSERVEKRLDRFI